MAIWMKAAFPVQQSARVGQAIDRGLEGIVVEIVDEQRRTWDQGAREAGTGDDDATARDGLRGVCVPWEGFWEDIRRRN